MLRIITQLRMVYYFVKNIYLIYLLGYYVTFLIFAGSLESANSSILASCDHFKEVVGKKIRVLW